MDPALAASGVGYLIDGASSEWHFRQE